MKTIIITGAQGSGKTRKANELSSKYPYKTKRNSETTSASIYEYPSKIPDKKVPAIIITVQKSLLNQLLTGLNHSNFIILDMDL